MIRDTQYGFRLLRRTPVFTIVSILTLAVGIGANAAIFQLIDTIELRSLPIANPQELKPGNNMPTVPMNGRELNAIAAYLETLR